MVELVYEEWFFKNCRTHHNYIEDKKYEREEAFRVLEILYSSASNSVFYDDVYRTDNAFVAIKFDENGKVVLMRQCAIK